MIISNKLRKIKRIRHKIFGTAERPRLAVFRSNRHILAQIIDDNKGATIVAASDFKIKEKKNPTEKAFLVGKLIADLAASKKITQVVFDRHGYKYHGRVKSLADGAREGGLKI